MASQTGGLVNDTTKVCIKDSSAYISQVLFLFLNDLFFLLFLDFLKFPLLLHCEIKSIFMLGCKLIIIRAKYGTLQRFQNTLLTKK